MPFHMYVLFQFSLGDIELLMCEIFLRREMERPAVVWIFVFSFYGQRL